MSGGSWPEQQAYITTEEENLLADGKLGSALNWLVRSACQTFELVAQALVLVCPLPRLSSKYRHLKVPFGIRRPQKNHRLTAEILLFVR